MKLLAVTFGTLLVAFILFMTIRMWGEGQAFKPFDAPFFKGPTPVIIIPWEQNFLLEKNPDFILWADIYRGEGENLLVKPWIDRNKGKKELEQKPSPARPLLKDLLLKYPNTRFVINCNDNVQDIHRHIVQVLEETKSIERVMLQSDFNTILISAKTMNPMLVFGSTVADMTRLKMFDSMYLLPAAPFKGDVFFTPLTYRGRKALSKDIVLEMKRRFKKVFIGPLNSKEEIELAKSFEPDGFFIADPLLVLQP